MPSIFIWKSDVPNNSKRTIRYYSGSNWALEDTESSSKSYIYLEQIVIPGFNDSVITFNIKNMPQDWTGSELLEVTCCPYEFIKSDNYGTLERVGDWLRFTSKNDIIFESDILQKEFAQIKKWIGQHSHKIPPPCPPSFPKNFELDMNKIKLNFEEFVNKYAQPVINTNNLVIPSTYSNKRQHNKQQYKNKSIKSQSFNVKRGNKQMSDHVYKSTPK